MTTLIQIGAGNDGIRLALPRPDVAIEYHHPCKADRFSFAVPLAALADCEGRSDGVVQFEPRAKGRVEMRWQQSGGPCQREYAPRDASPLPFPTWPGRDSANEPALLNALADAMDIPTGSSGRLALTCVQLRGRQGDVVATDGRQLLIQRGFRFPWQDSVLVPRTSVFAAREMRNGEAVRVAQSKTHVFFRIGGWTIVLPIETSARYPNVDAVIPNAAQTVTTWHVADEDAPALAAVLDDLPAAKEDGAPVTLELARPALIRARNETEKRCTEVLLPRSNLDGKRLRVATDRRFLQRALRLGFRSVKFTAADKPILCQDGQRVFVWVPLDPESALAPQIGAVRMALPVLATKNGRSTVVIPPSRPRIAATPTRIVAPVTPLRLFDGFRVCAQGLWKLVLKHRQQQSKK